MRGEGGVSRVDRGSEGSREGWGWGVRGKWR